MYYILCFLLFVLLQVHAQEPSREDLLRQESKKVLERCYKLAEEFYSLPEGEITEAILQSDETAEEIKKLIVATKRRFFIFTYPSDSCQVKGYLSFVPDSEDNPLLLFLRGGNRLFGLMHPANDFSCMRNYTVLATAYRMSDEFGGGDVNDVANLLAYFPTLQQKFGLKFSPKETYILGGSRGGMQMFLALARNQWLQNQVTKAASLSGLLDMRACMTDRPDMRAMFIRDFGLDPETNEEEWVEHRNPISHVSKIRKDLSFLILQGAEDLRVSTQEGLNMVEALEQNGNPVTYIEVKASHCLGNDPKRIDRIADWFEG